MLDDIGDMALSNGMRLGRRCFVVFLACLWFSITAVAYSDPPDPLWLPGFWDDDDFDNTVMAVSAATAVIVEPSVSATIPIVSRLESPPGAVRGSSPRADTRSI